MRTVIVTMIVVSVLSIASRTDAQTPSAGGMRVYTFNAVPQPYSYPAFGYGDAYPELLPYRNQAADSSYLDYLWPYRDSEVYRRAYEGDRRYRYPASGYAWRDYLAPYRNPPRGYGRPTYPGVWGGTASSNSPYLRYQDRRTSRGRAFPNWAAPTYQPRAGGMFDR